MSRDQGLIFISVVRDFDFYDRFFTGNPYVNRHTLVPIDNRKDNLFIPLRYNAFLESYDYSEDAWFVFCHEDFELQEDIAPVLSELDKNAIYGPVGCRLYTAKETMFGKRMKSRYLGEITCSNKDGSDLFVEGRKIDKPERVDTVDCVCLIVHSSLVRQAGLRFGEELSFDLYAEDFCIQAARKCGIPTYAVQLACRHWSKGVFGERFYKQLIALNKKYKDATYAGTCAIIGKQPHPFKSWRRMTLNRLKLFFSKRK